MFTSTSSSENESANNVQSEYELETNDSEEEEKGIFFKCVPIIFWCVSCYFPTIYYLLIFLCIFSLSVIVIKI